jgi:autotransporter-associated beta strand protein
MRKHGIYWIAAGMLWLALSPQTFAASVTWDPAMSGGMATGGAGTWSTSTTNWWTSSTDQVWNNAGSDTAVFASQSGAVTLSGSLNVGGLLFASTGNDTLSPGTLDFVGSAPMITIASTTTDTINSVLTGTGGLAIQAGSGILVFGTSNSYSGGTVINGGTLSVKNDAGLGAAPSSAATNITLNGGALTFTSTTALNANRTVSLGASGGTLNATYIAGGSLSPTTSVYGVRLLGQITGNGALTLNGGTGHNNSVSAPYLFLLDSLANNFTGNTAINNATVINDAGTSTATNILPVTTVLTLSNSAVFGFYDGSSTQTLAGLAGDSTTAIGTANTGTAASLTIDPAAGKSYTFSGTIEDLKVFSQGVQGTGGAALSLTLAGQGTEVFSGSNLYNGATNINSGTLSLSNGTLAGAGVVTVGVNGTLGGNGSIAAATTVNGTLNPSLGGSLNFKQSLTLNSGATFVLQAGGGTVGSVQNVTSLNAIGALTLMPLSLDNTTFNGVNNFPFLSWTSIGPTAGVQSNWSIYGPNVVTWTGSGDGLTWSSSGNWSGSNVSGGTVQAMYNNGVSGSGYLEVNGLSLTSGLVSVSNAYIQVSAGVTVAGPTAMASVQGLTVGSTSGAANTLNFGLGIINVTGPSGVLVNPTGILNLGNGSLQTTSLNLAGSMSVCGSGSLTTSGTMNVNNLGVLSVSSSGFIAPTTIVNPGGTILGTSSGAFAFSGGNTITVNGQLQIGADGALGNISPSVVVGTGAEYNFAVRQSTSPTLNIPAGVGLFGDLTNFTFGSSGSISLAANAVLSPSAVNLPTRSQLGGAVLLMPLTAADTGSFTVGDDGSTSIFKGLSLGSWTTVGGVPGPTGVPLSASNGAVSFTSLPSFTFAGTITDSATNGFTVYLNGQNMMLSASASLNTSNTSTGVEFDGLGNVQFPASGAVPGGSASVYTRAGYFDALNTSGGTSPNTTGNQTLVTFANVANNLAGKTLNLQDLTLNAVTNINAKLIASSGTINFNAYSAMYNSGTTFSQGTFNFAPTAIYRIGNDARLTSGATFNFQTGAMVSIAEATVNTSAWSVPSNVDLVVSSEADPIAAAGTTGIVLGDGRTLSSPWNTSSIALNLSASTTLSAAPGASSVRLAGANGQTLTVNGPLELGSATLIINDIPSNTLYVPANGDSDFTRQPGGSVLDGTVVLGNATATATLIPAVYVKGGTLRLSNTGALGTAAALTVGAPDAGAGTATLELGGHNLTVTGLSGASTGIVTNSIGSGPATLSVVLPASTVCNFAGTLTNGYYITLGLSISGQGTEILSGSNSYSGGTYVGGGTLQLGNSLALGNNSGALTVNAGVLDLNGSSPVVASLSGSAGLITNSSSASLATLDVSGGYASTSTFSGTLRDGEGSLGLQVDGGTLTLAGSNSYSGGTNVASGMLILNGAQSLAAGSSLTIGYAPNGENIVFADASPKPQSAAISVTPAPEPGTLVLFIVAAMMLALGRFVAWALAHACGLTPTLQVDSGQILHAPDYQPERV